MRTVDDINNDKDVSFEHYSWERSFQDGVKYQGSDQKVVDGEKLTESFGKKKLDNKAQKMKYNLDGVNYLYKHN